MKKLYMDVTERNECIVVIVEGVEIIHAGTTISSMSVKEKNSKYERYADEYDVHFIFDDAIPRIGFYTVPQVDIFATDSHGGFIGTVGQTSDLQSGAPICYIDNSLDCYLIAENARDFINGISKWRNRLKKYNGITFFSSKTEAEKAVEFLDLPESVKLEIKNMKNGPTALYFDDLSKLGI